MSPLYDYYCNRCKGIKEILQRSNRDTPPKCCGIPMRKLPTFPAMVKIMGEGGYPSRRKFLRGSAPGATRATNAWGTYNPTDKSIGGIGQKIKEPS